MDKLTALITEADRNGIMIDFEAPNCISSSIVNLEGTIILGLCEKNLRSRSEFTYSMAHEMGHYYTGTYYNFKTPLQMRGQIEYRADTWAAYYLLPYNQLLTAVESGYTQSWELAEYFGVPESFIWRSVYIYRSKGLIA